MNEGSVSLTTHRPEHWPTRDAEEKVWCIGDGEAWPCKAVSKEREALAKLKPDWLVSWTHEGVPHSQRYLKSEAADWHAKSLRKSGHDDARSEFSPQ